MPPIPAVPPLGAHVVEGGITFAVWAPERRRVVVEWEAPDGRRGERGLERDRSGVWRGLEPELGAGTLYGYRLDDEGLFPDPYARALPEGVHGRAEVIDPLDFAWTDQNWPGLRPRGQILYELHVGCFTPEGTFDGVVGQLDHLAALGITAIELMPVSSFPGRWGWGYDGVGHFAPAHIYGGPRGLRRLVDAAHRRGIGVVLDVVYNHLGPSGNYLRQFSPHYFTDRYHTPWGDALNYDGPRSRRVRDWAIDSATRWIVEYHLDGLRLDATAEIHDRGRRHVLRELADRVRAAVDRPVLLIAEDDRRDVSVVRRRGGLALDAFWADDFHHSLRSLLTGTREGYFAAYQGTAAELGDALRHGLIYRGQHSPLRRRPWGRPTGRTEAAAFVFCLENHDQVGNRAHGERLAHLVSPAAYRAASALLLFAPETPLLFMGQEFAASTPFQYFSDHEPDLGRLITEGRRREFAGFAAFAAGSDAVPDPQAETTFRRSVLRLEERHEHAPVYRLYADLIALRTSDPVLARQDRSRLRAAAIGDRALAFALEHGDERRLIVSNFGPTLESPLPAGLAARGRWSALLSTDDPDYGGEGRPAVAADGVARVPAETTVLFARG